MNLKDSPITTVRINNKDHRWFSRKAKREGVTQARLFSEMKDAYLRMQEMENREQEARA